MDLSNSLPHVESAEPTSPADARLLIRGESLAHTAGMAEHAAIGKHSRTPRRRLVSSASEFLSRHAAEGVRIGTLAKVTGVSERTLRNAFYAEHGLSPKKFDLRQRLFGARHALRRAESSGTTVTSVACEFGFYELGRFALAYKKAFGELPSATIKGRQCLMRSSS